MISRTPKGGSGCPGPGAGRGELSWPRHHRGRRCHPPEQLSERQTPNQRPGVAPRAIRCGRNLQGCPQCRAWTISHQVEQRRGVGQMEEARGPPERAARSEAEASTSPALSARGAGTPSKSKEALGNHLFLLKGPTLGFPPALWPSPTMPWEETERGFFLWQLLPPAFAGLRV